jgi:propionyl-CoA synthetase
LVADRDRLADRRQLPLGIESFPVKYGSATKPCPGWDVQVLDEAGQVCGRSRARPAPGVCKLPLPPGCGRRCGTPTSVTPRRISRPSPAITTGDAGFIDEDGYLFIMTRTDDVINVAGHRLSTGAIEEVAGRASRRRRMRGDRRARRAEGPGAAGLRGAEGRGDPAGCRDRTRDRRRWCASASGRSPAFKTHAVVDRLPKTRSGKILRGEGHR